MPQSRQHPHRQQIENLTAPGTAVAAQGDVHIVPEPEGERHVPAAPELRSRLGNIRIVEVFRQAEAENPPQANGHIRIAGEIKVELESVGDAAQPGQGHGQPVSGGKGRVGNDTQGVGQQHLLGKAEAKAVAPAAASSLFSRRCVRAGANSP